MNEDQLQLVDNFENMVRAEADEDFLSLYEEHQELQRQFTNLQQQYLKHLEEHTSYIIEIHNNIKILSEALRKASISASFYIATTLAAVGYIFFTI